MSQADPPTPAAAAARAAEMAERTRSAEALASDARGRRDAAIIAAIEAGLTTRELGRICGLTASQVSAIWRRTHPARPRRARRAS